MSCFCVLLNKGRNFLLTSPGGVLWTEAKTLTVANGQATREPFQSRPNHVVQDDLKVVLYHTREPSSARSDTFKLLGPR